MPAAIDIRGALRALLTALAAVVAAGIVCGTALLWVAEMVIELLAAVAR